MVEVQQDEHKDKENADGDPFVIHDSCLKKF